MNSKDLETLNEFADHQMKKAQMLYKRARSSKNKSEALEVNSIAIGMNNVLIDLVRELERMKKE